MKIAFICGSLEPGCDGVGDYVRILASEIVRLGHQASVLAIHDPYLNLQYSGIQSAGSGGIPVLRVPSRLSTKKRFEQACQWIDDFAPDWISIQFVPYAFHWKGLPFAANRYFKKMAENKHVHIMFHEMWVDGTTRGWRSKMTSALQKVLIERMLRSLRPAAVHTHIPLYRLRLKKLGCAGAKPLMLFSNIEAACSSKKNKDNDIFRIGIFSQVANSATMISFLSSLGKHLLDHHVHSEVLLVGGQTGKMVKLAEEISSLVHYNNKVRCTGFLPAKELSEALQTCTLGLTPVPRHLLGKSGSVMAFLAHGVPVAAPNVQELFDDDNIGFFTHELRSSIVLEPDMNQIHRCTEAAIKARAYIQPDKIARTLLADLSSMWECSN
jgi:hypothetical protein